MVDHLDIARQAFDASALPAPPRTVEQALAYLNRLLSLLPPEERGGYVTAPPGADNSAFLPDGTFVRVARVCYPDGQLYKVMSDVPNGGPIWSDNGMAPGGTRYVAFGSAPQPNGGGVVPPPPPRPPTAEELRAMLAPMLEPILARLNDLDAKAAALHSVFSALTQQVGTINQQIADLSAKTSPPLPDYIGRVGPITVISRPRT